jgi:hypothetical protein
LAAIRLLDTRLFDSSATKPLAPKHHVRETDGRKEVFDKDCMPQFAVWRVFFTDNAHLHVPWSFTFSEVAPTRDLLPAPVASPHLGSAQKSAAYPAV